LNPAQLAARRTAWLRFLTPRLGLIWLAALVAAIAAGSTGHTDKGAAVAGLVVGVAGTFTLIAHSADTE
jgi:hypothetical protein